MIDANNVLPDRGIAQRKNILEEFICLKIYHEEKEEPCWDLARLSLLPYWVLNYHKSLKVECPGKVLILLLLVNKSPIQM